MNRVLFFQLQRVLSSWRALPLIVIGFFFTNLSTFAQPITGIVPVQTPVGGSGVDGDAMAHTPAGYENVGDLFDGVHLNGTHGVLDLTTGNLLYPGFTFFLQDPYLDDKTIFTTSNKINDDPNTYTWGAGTSPDKNEIQNAGAHFSYGDPNLGGVASDLWVLFAGDRQVTNGSSYIDFEFLQKSLTITGAIYGPVNPQTMIAPIVGGSGSFVSQGTDGGRTVGDVLLTIEFQQGGDDAIVSIRKWEEVAPDVFEYVIHPNSEFIGDIFITQNTAETDVPFDVYGTNPGTYAVNQWAEGAANLSQLFSEDPCFSISTLFIRTRSSGNSNQSELKDFPGAPIQLTVNNIPTVAVNSPVRCSSGPAATVTATPDPNGTYTFDWDVPPGAADPGDVASFQTTVAGTYSVTITSTLGCQASGSGEVTVVTPPNAGTDGNTTVCETSTTPINLFSLINGEQAGGTWTRTTGTGGTFNAAAGTFTPAMDATNSTFTYTVAGTAPCPDDTSVATVNINNQPNAGDDGNTTVCDSSVSAINLFTLITGEDAGGTWARTSGTGGTFNAAAGTYTPAPGATTSTFTYTLTATAPCVNDSSVATVNINAQPNAGDDGSTTVCESSIAAINLFTLITGEQAGGTWTRTSGTGGTFNAATGTFTPALDATTSTFIYTLIGTAPCVNDSSTATVNINSQPNAGDDGNTTVCDSSVSAINLFSLITGEDAGGTWTRTTGTGGTFNAAAGTYTPAPGATTSTFTYTLAATAPCVGDSSVATVNINAQPNAGDNGSTTVCDSSGAAINLFSLITGEQAGGTWARTSGTGGTFNAATGTYTPAPGATTSIFTYTLTGTAPCTNDSSTATVNINAQPNAGNDGSTTVCSNAAAVDLFGLITGEQPGGTWTRTTGTGGTFNAAAGTFTPAAGATNSTFTYTVAGTAPCIDDSSVATVNITQLPTATISYGGPYCNDLPGLQSVTLNGTGAYTGGTFSATPPGLTINATTGAINPDTSAVGVYTVTYTIAASGGCPEVTATGTVTIQDCGMEGCTLGYWKNHTNRWCATYTTSTIYGSVFTNAPSALASLNFLQVLNLGGGGIYNLGRQSVAAILNACSLEVAYPAPYGDSPQAVINAVNAAFLAGGSAPGNLATALDILNNTGCPLNGTAATRPDHHDVGFTIYPIPFKENLTVHYNYDSPTDVKIEIVNILGKVLMTHNQTKVSKGTDIVLTPDFVVGDGQIYFVRITSNDAVTIHKVVSGY